MKAFFYLALMLFSSGVSATPIGFVDQVRHENGVWHIKGWTCEPNHQGSIKARLILNNSIQYEAYTAEPTDIEIKQLCGTTGNPNILHRYSLSYSGALSGQTVRVQGVAPGSFSGTDLGGSGEHGLPANSMHPLQVLKNSLRILIYTAHPDDEILFSPVLGDICATRSCRIVVATQGGGPGAICHYPHCAFSSVEAVRSAEMQNSAALFPMGLNQGHLSASVGATVAQILAAWDSELVSAGKNYGLQQIIHEEIDFFKPNSIITFDPRHGTTCNPDHRAVGQAIHQHTQTYPGTHFNKSNVFFLTTRLVLGNGYIMGLTPAVPKDSGATTYSASDNIPSKGKTGWEFLQQIMSNHPSQFLPAEIANTNQAHALDRATAFQPIAKYSFSDVRYNFCN